MATRRSECAPFTVADHTTDIVLVVEDKQIHFTKLLLTLCSPVFDRMFQGDFLEKYSKEIPLPGKSYEDMVTFLKLIHPNHAHTTAITDNNILSLLGLCREYQVESIRSKVEQYIGAGVEVHAVKKLTADRLLLFLYACDEYKLEKHVQALKTFAQAETSVAFKRSDNFKKFSSTPSFIEALNSRCGSLENVLTDLKKVVEKCGPYLPKKDRREMQCQCHYFRVCEQCALVQMRCELQSLISQAKELTC